MSHKWARRRDTSHPEIVEQLRDDGWLVKDVANCAGFVDLVVTHPRHRHLGVILIEAKKPGKERRELVGAFTAGQRQMEADGWPLVVLTSKADAHAWHLSTTGADNVDRQADPRR